ncbi:MAG TPA: vWA domain-containing protein [Kofleriaceae bacterium]
MHHRASWVLVMVVVVGCGGSKSVRESPPVPTNVPRSSSANPLVDQLKYIAARLTACEGDLTAASPRDASEACKLAVTTLLAGCGSADLRALEASDHVSESCKESLWKLLPERDSHRSRVLVMGAARADGVLDVYVAASDDRGEPAPATFGELTIQLEVAGRLEVVETTSAPLPARCDRPLFSASSILDYSGSMSDHDIDDSIEIMRTLYTALPQGCLESDVIVFSTQVRRTHEATADRRAMSAAVARNDRMPRATTALVDAIGDGATGVSKRTAPIRLLLVATDGMENASTRWSYADALRVAETSGTRIISFGSLLSDVGFLEMVGAQTGGFFIYRPRPSVLAAAAHSVGRLLGSTRRLRVVDARLATATHVIVQHGSQTIRIPLQ